MPRLSLIIAALGDVAALENTLVSVLENRPRDCEIVVALGFRYDNPYELDDEVRFVAIERRPNWARCLNQALPQCRGRLVHVLTDGVTVSPGWCDAATASFDDPQVAAATTTIHSAQRRDDVLSVGVRVRKSGRVEHLTPDRNGRLPARAMAPSHLAGFYRRAALDWVQGAATSLGDAYADVDLGLRMGHKGFSTVVAHDCHVYVDSLARSAAGAWASGVGAERFYRRHMTQGAGDVSRLGHALGLCGELVSSVVRPANLVLLAGRTFGALLQGHDEPLAAITSQRDAATEHNSTYEEDATPATISLSTAQRTPPPQRRRAA